MVVQLFRRYIKEIGSIFSIDPNDTTVSYFAIPFITKTAEDKEKLIKELDSNNIVCRPLISGSMGIQPFYKKLYGENKLPNCSIIDEKGVYVPNHDKMTKEDIDRVCDILLKY